MERTSDKYKTLFFSTLQISACTFGGGFVIIPLLRKRFVEELHWVEEQEMLDLTAIAQSSPGPIAVNAAILVGYRVAGVGGALLTVLGAVLPPLVILSLVSVFYTAFRNSRLVSLAMAGMLAGVAAVICDVVYTMTKGLWQQRRALPLVMLAAAFVASRYLHVNIILLILACGAVGAVDTLRKDRARKKQVEEAAPAPQARDTAPAAQAGVTTTTPRQAEQMRDTAQASPERDVAPAARQTEQMRDTAQTSPECDAAPAARQREKPDEATQEEETP